MARTPDPLSDTFYNQRAWRRLAAQVREKHNHECQECKRRGIYRRAVLVHHHRARLEYPELAMSETYIDSQGQERPNLIPLCHPCHEQIELERGNRTAYGSKAEPLTPERW